MRLLILFLLAQLIAFSAFSQVLGIAKDVQGAPLPGATVSLLKAKDSAVVKLAVSKENGTYLFADVKDGEYRIGVSHVGYQPFYTPVFKAAGGELKVPDATLVKAAGTMNAITVTAHKPLVEIKADKTVLNVEGTINATGSTALELLRKSPGVLVDKDENLSLSGKNGVQVYIDGRPSPLAGQDLANYLKALQSSQVESIELITNPSAKYEAAGNAGIINIRLKKNKAVGANGSVNAGYNAGVYSKYNGGFSLNYRNKNVNLYSNYSNNYMPMANTMSINRTVADSLFEQGGDIKILVKSQNIKAGIDYTLTKKSSVGVVVNGTFASPTIHNYSRTIISNTDTKVVRSQLVADNNADMKRNNLNLNLNYNYSDPKGTSLTVNADRGRFNLHNDQHQPNYYYTADGQSLVSSVIYQTIAPTQIDITSTKIDYEQNLWKGKLSVGGKTAFVKNDNDFQRYNVYNTGRELDRDVSNRFLYKENINAGYVSYLRPMKGKMLQLGLRVENTGLEGTSTGVVKSGGGYKDTASSFKRAYTDFFPSAALTFNKNPMKQWSLTYSRRIDRPAYQDLNPFEFKLDEYTFQKGNINLRPQYTNSFGVTHTYKYKLTATLNYSHVKDIFTQLIDTADRSKAFISKQNLARQDITSLNISYPFTYKAYSVFTNINTNYSKYNADFGNGKTVDLAAFSFNFFAQNSLKFGKTWTAELSGMYNAPTVYMGSFKARSMWSADAGLQKGVMGGKGTIKASVSDVFGTMRFLGTSEFAGQVSKVNQSWESRQFKLSFTMRFGSTTVKAAKQKTGSAEDEMKRAQQSGGIGVGQ